MNNFQLSSDHYIHVNIIKKIRKSNFSFRITKLSCYNEKHTAYPIFFHYILALFFYDTAVNFPMRIVRGIQFLSLLSFNIFLFFFTELSDFLFYLKANLVYLSFPISYVFWNAKNRGLSARGFGLLLGQVFIYLVVFWLKSENLIFLPLLTLTSLLILISSQFGFQFILFFSLLFSLVFLRVELLLTIITSIIFFRFFFPTVSKDFFIGQYYHKRNYSRFLAPIHIFKRRPDIYRDLIYDFWKKLFSKKTPKIKALYYIYTNPVIEMLYGFPFIWITLIYIIYSGDYFSIQMIDKLILLSVLLFVFISLRPLRFLGEPQRYVEFLIPLISISFIIKTPNSFHFFSILLSTSFILFVIILTNKTLKNFNNPYEKILDYFKDNFDSSTIIVSNDSDFSKFLVPFFKILKTDLLRNYKSITHFNKFHFKNFSVHSSFAIIYFYKKYGAKILVLNKELYDHKENENLTSKLKLKFIEKIGKFDFYKIQGLIN